MNLKDLKFYNISWRYDTNWKPWLRLLVWDEEDGMTKELLDELPFRPYFFIRLKDYYQDTIFVQDLLREVDKRAQIERVPFKNHLSEDMIKISVTAPSKVPKIRKALEEHNITTYEADIVYGKRVMIDCGLNIAKPTKKLYFDLEVDPRGEFPDPNFAKKRILSIGCIDQDGSRFFFSEEDEEEMIGKFLDLASKYHLMIGWNSGMFDRPYLENRCNNLGIQVDWFLYPHIDLLYLYKKSFTREEESYRLADLARTLFGIEVTDYESQRKVEILWEFFLHDKPSLEKYNIEDALTTKMIDDRFGLTDMTWEVAHICKTYCDQRYSNSSGVDGLILHLSTLEGDNRVVWPNRRYNISQEEWERDTPFTGGLTLKPIPGLHKDVLYMDYKSLYNRIIQTFNIGLDTYKEGATGPILTPNGSYVLSTSIFVKAVKLLETLRNQYKAEMKKYDIGSVGYNVWHMRQESTKFFLLSFYGCLGYRKSRYYKREVAEDIPLLGREILKYAMSLAERFGFQVIYADTDGLFLKPVTQVTNLLELGENFRDLLNKNLQVFVRKVWPILQNVPLELELNQIYQALYFTAAKKRYAGRVIWEDKPVDYIWTRGFELVRKDWPIFAREIQEHLFEMILDEASKQDILSYLKSVRERMFRGEFDKQLVKRTSMSKELQEYTKSKGPHVKAAQQIVDAGYDVRKGDKIPYLQVGKGKVLAILKDGEIPRIRPRDYSYLWEHVIDPLLERLDLGQLGQTTLEEFL